LVKVKTKEVFYPEIIESLIYPTGSNVSVETNVSITFNQPMDRSSVENAFNITPYAKGTFIWIDNTMIFDPDNDLIYNTNYTVILYEDAFDLIGNNLQKDYSWNFSTEVGDIKESDLDNDGIPDSIDPDDDNDKFDDIWEDFLGTDSADPNDTPLDSDNDMIPDGDITNSQPWMDFDDDNDNYLDAEELKAGTNPLNPDDNPSKKVTEEKSDSWLYSIIVFGIIFFLVILILLISLKPKKVSKPEEIEEDEELKPISENVRRSKKSEKREKEDSSEPNIEWDTDEDD
jgi:hypothetical protein